MTAALVHFKWRRDPGNPVLPLDPASAWESARCMNPFVVRSGGEYWLYYSGGAADGRQRLCLATTPAVTPLITGDQTVEFPHNRGVAGGGTIVEERRADGAVQYRMYYTLAVGRKSPDVRVDQEKHCAVCHSVDGIRWTDHRLIMSPRKEVPNEDIAVAAPFVWREAGIYRMLYCGIGTRWGYYSISEAVSADGYIWERGKGDANLIPRFYA
jgi:predicted GH43/DUF377 family glycosyl hydrolase